MLAAAGLTAGLGALSLGPAFSARDHLDAGRAELVRAEGALLSGDTEGAVRAFDRARSSFLGAADDANDPILRLVGFLPLIGRTPDAIGILAEVAIRVASAGRGLSEAVATLPGGLGSLAPQGGVVPIERLRSLAPAVNSMTAELVAAQQEASRLPDSLLLGPLSAVGNQVRDELDGITERVRDVGALLEALPWFAGEGGVRRYFVAAQNPAELRGTGGFIGAYAIMTATAGRLTLGPFRDIASLPNVPVTQAPAPSPGFAEMYDRFGGAGFWRNLNMTPDAPTAAVLIESLYERVTGIHLDGTIFIDPQAVADLLTATGPVEVPIIGRVLTADDVVPYLTNEAYFVFGSDLSRKRVLGVAVHAVWQRFLTLTDPRASLPALAAAASQGHIVLHATDPGVQTAFERSGLAGKLGVPQGDFLGVFASNAAGNKVDYYVARDVRYEITLGAGGTGSAQALVRLTNHAPAGRPPGYVLGPYPGTGLGVGDNLSFVSTYCARDCQVMGATEDGRPSGVESHTELGYPLVATYVRVAPQRSRTLGLSFQLSRAWQGNDLGGTYRLRIQGQPTIRPTTVTVVIRAPQGMSVVDTSVPMEVRGNEAVWRGTVSDEQDFLIRFSRPFLPRVWTQVWGWLSEPVIRL